MKRRQDDEILNEGLIDAADVGLPVVVVVGEGQRRDVLRVQTQVEPHLFGHGNAGEQQDGLVVADARQRTFVTAVELPQLAVAEGAEVETLIGHQVQGLLHHAEAHRLDIVGTFRDDDDVGTPFPLLRFAQSARRQQTVVGYHAVIVDKQDIDTRMHVAVLVGIVEQDDVDVARGLVGAQALDAAPPVVVDGHVGRGELLLHLPRFVADFLHGALRPGQYVATRLTLVAAAEYSHAVGLAQQAQQVLRVRCLSRSADAQVADADDGDVVTVRLQYVQVEQGVA